MPDNDTVFDAYGDINESRKNFLQKVLPPLISKCRPNTALDVGCGAGFSSQWLSEAGMKVRDFDARVQNVQETRKRYPSVEFYVDDLDKSKGIELGASDLVLCFGLSYLVNPSEGSSRRVLQADGIFYKKPQDFQR